MQYTFTAPINNDPEDNESLTTKTTVSFLNCRGFFPEPSPENGDNSGFWNCNVCPNDDKYCQPYVVGDIIYIQLPYKPFVAPEGELLFPLGPYFNIMVDGEPVGTPPGVTTQIGPSVTGSDDHIPINYINVAIDTSDPFFTANPCWYFQIALQNENLLTDGSGNPIGQPMLSCFQAEYAANGGDYDAAIDHCAYLHKTDKYNTEFYCIVGCEEQTILIKGDYTTGLISSINGFDCNGKYYGYIDDGFNFSGSIYKSQVRVRGIVEPAGYEFEETKINTSKVKGKQREVFILYTKKIPYYVAKQIAACFNSKVLTIDDVEYSGALKLSKNFEEGNMWIIKENIYIDCDEINFSCQ